MYLPLEPQKISNCSWWMISCKGSRPFVFWGSTKTTNLEEIAVNQLKFDGFFMALRWEKVFGHQFFGHQLNYTDHGIFCSSPVYTMHVAKFGGLQNPAEMAKFSRKTLWISRVPNFESIFASQLNHRQWVTFQLLSSRKSFSPHFLVSDVPPLYVHPFCRRGVFVFLATKKATANPGQPWRGVCSYCISAEAARVGWGSVGRLRSRHFGMSSKQGNTMG